MRWVTRHEPHFDRCASAWLIKRFIDRDAEFEFVNRGDQIPTGAMPFVLPGAEINPIEGIKTTFDVLVDKYDIWDQIVLLIQRMIHDFEVEAKEDLQKLRLRETAGVFMIIRGLARTSRSDHEILSKAFMIFDSLYAQLKAEKAERRTDEE